MSMLFGKSMLIRRGITLRKRLDEKLQSEFSWLKQLELQKEKLCEFM